MAVSITTSYYIKQKYKNGKQQTCAHYKLFRKICVTIATSNHMANLNIFHLIQMIGWKSTLSCLKDIEWTSEWCLMAYVRRKSSRVLTQAHFGAPQRPCEHRFGKVGPCGSVVRLRDCRVFAGSNPTGTAWKLWQFTLPHFASVFRKRLKPVGLFGLVSMPGEVKIPDRW